MHCTARRVLYSTQRMERDSTRIRILGPARTHGTQAYPSQLAPCLGLLSDLPFLSSLCCVRHYGEWRVVQRRCHNQSQRQKSEGASKGKGERECGEQDGSGMAFYKCGAPDWAAAAIRALPASQARLVAGDFLPLPLLMTTPTLAFHSSHTHTHTHPPQQIVWLSFHPPEDCRRPSELN